MSLLVDSAGEQRRSVYLLLDFKFETRYSVAHQCHGFCVHVCNCAHLGGHQIYGKLPETRFAPRFDHD